MVTKRNLCLVPAVKVDASTWFPTSSDYVRITGAHASLPRSTAFRGTLAAQVVMSRATVTAGKYYVVSASIRAEGPQTATLGMDWRTSGNTYLSATSGTGSTYGEIGLGAGSTGRFALVGQAPADAGRLTPVINGVDAGGIQVTAVMVREFATLVEANAAAAVDVLPGNYFDGDTAGATWDGANGESTSTLIADEAPSASTVFGAQTTSVTRIRDYATASTVWGAQVTVTGLIPTVSWDPRRGRVRISAVGLSATVVRAEVSSRPVGTSRWSPVRGGSVAVLGGRFVRTVDDYEFTAGEGMEYRIQAISTAENITPVNVVQTVVADIADTLDQVWLKFIVAPALNRRVSLTGWSPVRRTSRQAVYGIRNRPTPIVVTDVHGSRTVDVQLVTWTEEEGESLETALASGLPVFFQTPTNVQLRGMYASVGTFEWVRQGGVTSPRRRWTVPLTEVSAPPLSVVGPGFTYQNVVDQYVDFAEVLDTFPTYLDLVG